MIFFFFFDIMLKLLCVYVHRFLGWKIIFLITIDKKKKEKKNTGPGFHKGTDAYILIFIVVLVIAGLRIIEHT